MIFASGVPVLCLTAKPTKIDSRTNKGENMASMSCEVTEETFLKDVGKHKATILLDNGIYRHIRCSSGSFNQQFDIVTYPDYLVFSGDMGSYVFTRLEDMFEFFRGRSKDGKLYVNVNYWSEKLEAVDRSGRKGSHVTFSTDRFKEHVEETIHNWIDDNPSIDEKDLREAVEDEIYCNIDDGEHDAYRALHEFTWRSNGQTYQFSEVW